MDDIPSDPGIQERSAYAVLLRCPHPRTVLGQVVHDLPVDDVWQSQFLRLPPHCGVHGGLADVAAGMRVLQDPREVAVAEGCFDHLYPDEICDSLCGLPLPEGHHRNVDHDRNGLLAEFLESEVREDGAVQSS